MNIFFYLVALVVLTLLAAPAGAAERAVIIVLDGLRSSEGFDDPNFTYVPRMAYELAPQGTLARVCSNNGQTVSVPGHTAVASGRYQSLPNDGSVRSVFPLLWEYYRDQTGAGGTSTLLPITKRKISILSYSTWVGYGVPDSARVSGPTWDDEVTTSRFLSEMTLTAPVVSFLNFGGIDMGANTQIWHEYIRAVQRADSLVAVIWQAIQANPLYAGKTDLIVTGDHGRHADGYGEWWDHGDGCPGCRRVPLLALGPDFRENVVSWTACEQIDICRTLGSLLGIQTPYAGGRILDELILDPAAVAPIGTPEKLRVAIDGRSVRFRIEADGAPVDLSIFDLLGRRLDRGTCHPGHDWSWKGDVAGVYFYSAGPLGTGRIVLPK